MSSSTDEDKRLIQRVIERKLSKETACRLLGGDNDDVRKFVARHLPQALSAYDALPARDADAAVVRTSTPTSGPKTPAQRRPGRWTAGQSVKLGQAHRPVRPVGRPLILDEDEEQLFQFLKGEIVFAEEERPFNCAPMHVQQEIGVHVRMFMHMRAAGDFS